MDIIGLPNCSSFMPLARHKARAPAMRLPSVLYELLNGFFIISVFLCMGDSRIARTTVNKKALLYMEKGLRNIIYDFTTSYTPFSLPTND